MGEQCEWKQDEETDAGEYDAKGGQAADRAT